MIPGGPIEKYLQRLAGHLPPARRRRRILAEVAQHLRDRACQLERVGKAPLEAEVAAVALFGHPARIVREFQSQSPLINEVDAMIRGVLTLSAVLAVAYAGLHFVFAFVDDAPTGQTVVKILVAAGVIGYGLVLLHRLWAVRRVSVFENWIVFAGSLAMIAVGTANAVWAAHLGMVSGDWEYYGFAGGGLIALVGVLTASWLMICGDRQFTPIAE